MTVKKQTGAAMKGKHGFLAYQAASESPGFSPAVRTSCCGKSQITSLGSNRQDSFSTTHPPSLPPVDGMLL
jgi:hypothetical protein